MNYEFQEYDVDNDGSIYADELYDRAIENKLI